MPSLNMQPTFSQKQAGLMHEIFEHKHGEINCTYEIDRSREFSRPMHKLLHDLEKNDPTITRVRQQTFGDAGAHAVSMAIRDNPHVTRLEFGNSQLSDAGAQALAISLQPVHNRSVTYLDLSSNKIGYGGIHPILIGLKHNETLKTLNLRKNLVGDAGAQALGGVLAKRYISGNGERATYHHCPVEHLDLSSNNISDVGAAFFFEKSLPTNVALRVLRLSHNRISHVSIATLASALAQNVGLVELHLNNNLIPDEGGIRLADAMIENRALRVLNLACNSVDDGTCLAFSNALKANSSLRALNLRSNQINDPGAGHLAQCLESANGTLTTLDLAGNKLLDDSGAALAQMLSSNTGLLNLYLDANQLTNRGARPLADALCGKLAPPPAAPASSFLPPLGSALQMMAATAPDPQPAPANHTLQLLDVGLNLIDEQGVAIFRAALEQNRGIVCLQFGCNLAHGVKRYLVGETVFTKQHQFQQFAGTGTAGPGS
jgi:Ran GTPase-activating protein (RanGAP) involved in mRNA processing and transport